MLVLKLSVLRSTLHRVPLGPCLPTAKWLSRAGVPRGRLAHPRGTCPPHAPAAGHSPDMPAPGAQEWTCPRGLAPKTGHVLTSTRTARARDWTCPQGSSRKSGHALRPLPPLDINPICPVLAPRNGHVPAGWRPGLDMSSGAQEQLEPGTGHVLKDRAARVDMPSARSRHWT